MLGIILGLIILSAGSIYAAATWGRKYEEILPISCVVVVFILFLCGMIGWMEIGVYIVGFISILLYFLAFRKAKKDRKVKAMLKNTFTPAFCVFFLLMGIFIYAAYGKVFYVTDEFSHWGDVVKVFYTTGRFSDYETTYSYCANYPPGVTLFQYFFQIINKVFPGVVFSEWLVYAAQQMLMVVFFIPFLKEMNYKKIMPIFMAFIVLFIVPWFFFPDIHSQLGVDPILSCLTGAGVGWIFLDKRKDIVYTLNIATICTMLVLTKDSGMLFATFIGVTYILDMILRKVHIRKLFGNILIVSSGVFLCKILWNQRITNLDLKIVYEKYDIFKIISFFTDANCVYEREIMKKFYKAFFVKNHGIEFVGVEICINYMAMMAILFILLAVFMWKYAKKENIYKKHIVCVWIAMVVLFGVYIVGLCFTYILNFTTYEATTLASYRRYMNTMFYAGYLFLVLIVICYFQCLSCKINRLWLILVGILLMVSPREKIESYLKREPVHISTSIRNKYANIINEINKYADGDDKITLIVQESKGFDFWVVKSNVRPNIMPIEMYWSIGNPFYEGDIWTAVITADEWKQKLYEEYDLVAIYKLNNYFIENFASVFAVPEDIAENSVYRVNKESGLLEKCK